jgi:hypothetical protein
MFGYLHCRMSTIKARFYGKGKRNGKEHDLRLV